MAGANPLESLPSGIRHLVTLLFGGTFIFFVFGVFPGSVVDLNHELGWPRWQAPAGRILGVALFLGSLGLVLYCSRLFSRIGKGTPVPIQPPTELVVSGIYQFSRNPIYVGQVAVLLSYFSYSGELTLLLYAFTWAVFVQSFILWFEEPQLRRRFGSAYLDYCRAVP